MNSCTLISKEKNVKTILSLTALVMLLVFSFNIFIDPFGQSLIKIDGLNNNSIVELDSIEKLNILEKEKIAYDSVVIGSSQISRMYAEDLDKKNNGEWIVFPIGSSMASEHYYYLQYFFKNIKIKKVIYGLDDSNFFGKYLYRGDTTVVKKKDYSLGDYLTFEAVEKSIDKIRYNQSNEEDKSKISVLNKRYQFFNGWEDGSLTEDKFNSQITNLKPNKIKSPSKIELGYLYKIRDEFSDKIIPLINFYHPYSLLMKNKHNYDLYVKNMINIFGEVWHINPKYLSDTLNPGLYYDHSHINRKFSKKIIDSIFSDSQFFIKINKKNYQQIINNLYNFSCEINFDMYTYHSFSDCK